MLASSLPANPSLENLRKRAKEFRDGARTGYPKFTDVVRALQPRLAERDDWTGFSLAEAQLVVARWYGFASWHRLREYLHQVGRYSRSPHRQPVASDVDGFLQLACVSYRSRYVVCAADDDRGRVRRARTMLAARPELATANIYTAAAVGDVATARALLAADAGLTTVEGGPYRWPPLLYLTFSRLDQKSTVELAALLLAHGADPNAGYLSDGEPPPVTALSGAFHGRRDPVNQPAHPHGLPLARLLLAAGANPNDERAVANACGYPYDDLGLALLLESGLGRPADDPWWTRLGPHPAHRDPAQLAQDELRSAAQRDLLSRVELLSPHVGSLDAPDEQGHSAYDLAIVAGNTEIADRLAAAGARVRPLSTVDQLVAAGLRGDHATAHRLADPTLVAQAGAGWPTPLHQAAYLNRPDAVRLLVAVGFPVDDRRGWPLHTAALCGHLDVVKVLIELGADPSAELIDDTPNQFVLPDATPLGWARYGDQHAVVTYLAALT